METLVFATLFRAFTMTLKFLRGSANSVITPARRVKTEIQRRIARAVLSLMISIEWSRSSLQTNNNNKSREAARVFKGWTISEWKSAVFATSRATRVTLQDL